MDFSSFDWSGFEDISTTVAETTSASASSEILGIFGFFLAIGIFFWIFSIAIAIFMIVVYWKLYDKAGKPGWAAIIPVYNLWILYEIAGLPGWLSLLVLIPFVGLAAVFVVGIIAAIKIAPLFGKESAFSVGLILLPVVFYPILAFGKAEYVGVGAPEPTTE